MHININIKSIKYLIMQHIWSIFWITVFPQVSAGPQTSAALSGVHIEISASL